jgi:hypothetical protein
MTADYWRIRNLVMGAVMSRLSQFARVRTLPVVLLLAALPLPAAADGAIAVGVPASVVDNGYAYGRSTNSANSKIASDHALSNCASAKDATQIARELCVVVMTFKNKCVALALDPKAGTPGAGWAIANTKSEAETQAMAQCLATAGAARRDSCQISDSACDGE